MKKVKVFYLWSLIGIALFIGSCADADMSADALSDYYDIAYIELFDTQNHEWIGGIADYPDSLEGKLDFSVDQLNMSAAFTGDNNALVISAKNPHKDLFYFITRKFEGLEANATYKISFTYEFLISMVNPNEESFTSDLFLKAGGTVDQPGVTIDQNYYGPGINNVALNYDKGEGTNNGTATIYYIGNIQQNISTDNPILVQGETDQDLFVQTNNNGEFWGIFGIDSKNEQELSFAFNTMIVFFKRI